MYMERWRLQVSFRLQALAASRQGLQGLPVSKHRLPLFEAESMAAKMRETS